MNTNTAIGRFPEFQKITCGGGVGEGVDREGGKGEGGEVERVFVECGGPTAPPMSEA